MLAFDFWQSALIVSLTISPQLIDSLAVFGLVGEEEEVLVLPLLLALGDIDFLARIGVITKVIHRGGVGHGRGCEVLYLIRNQMVSVSNIAKLAHFFDGAAWMGSNQVRNQLLVFAALTIFSVKIL